MQSYHKGKPFGPEYTVTSYPYTATEHGTESVWVDVEKEYPAREGRHDGFTSSDAVSLEDRSVVPLQSGGYAGMYNQWNVDKLVKPAPVGDPATPRSLRKLLEQPYAHLTAAEKVKATRYFLGQQAASFLKRKRAGIKEKLLNHTSTEV